MRIFLDTNIFPEFIERRTQYESVCKLLDAIHVTGGQPPCAKGIEPDKSYSGMLNVRLTPAIHRQIAMLARQAGMTLNAYIKNALEEKVETSVAI